jgi:hypothetical protein
MVLICGTLKLMASEVSVLRNTSYPALRPAIRLLFAFQSRTELDAYFADQGYRLNVRKGAVPALHTRPAYGPIPQGSSS